MLPALEAGMRDENVLVRRDSLEILDVLTPKDRFAQEPRTNDTILKMVSLLNDPFPGIVEKALTILARHTDLLRDKMKSDLRLRAKFLGVLQSLARKTVKTREPYSSEELESGKVDLGSAFQTPEIISSFLGLLSQLGLPTSISKENAKVVLEEIYARAQGGK